MNLSNQSNISKGLGGTPHRTLDSRCHQGTCLCLSLPISPLMSQSIEPHLLHQNMVTRPLGIILILLSRGCSLQNKGPNSMSLGHLMRNVLIHVKGSDTFLQTLKEINDTASTILKNKWWKALESKPLPSMVKWIQLNFWISWQTWTTTLSGMICLKRGESDSPR